MKYLTLLMIFLPSYLQACELQVSIDSWPPFFVAKGENDWTGLDVEILKAAVIGTDCKLNFVYVPPRRGLKYIAIGKLDIIMAASYTKERAKIGYFSEGYRDELIGLLMPKGIPELFPADALADIFDADVYISTQRGAWYGQEFEQIKKNPIYFKKLHFANSEAQALDMLGRNRVDGVATDVISGLDKARKLGLAKQMEFHPYLLNRDKVSFIFSRKSVSAELFKTFNDSLKVYMASESYQKHMAKYLPDIEFQKK